MAFRIPDTHRVCHKRDAGKSCGIAIGVVQRRRGVVAGATGRPRTGTTPRLSRVGRQLELKQWMRERWRVAADERAET